MLNGMSKHISCVNKETMLFSICFLTVLCFWQVESSCNFPLTHEVLQHECDLSRWLPWNCTCCGTDTITYFLAKRQRGICCQPGEPVQHCLHRCNYNATADIEYGQCGIVCPNPTGITMCSYVKTTTTTTTTTTPQSTLTKDTTVISLSGSSDSSATGSPGAKSAFVTKWSSTTSTNKGMTNSTQPVVTPSTTTFGSVRPTTTISTPFNYTADSDESPKADSSRTNFIFGTVGGVLVALGVVSCCLFILIRNKTKKNRVTTDGDQPALDPYFFR